MLISNLFKNGSNCFLNSSKDKFVRCCEFNQSSFDISKIAPAFWTSLMSKSLIKSSK